LAQTLQKFSGLDGEIEFGQSNGTERIEDAFGLEFHFTIKKDTLVDDQISIRLPETVRFFTIFFCQLGSSVQSSLKIQDGTIRCR
jgi:hypothetical protein